MVYSKERLKRALDVFRASEPYRKRRHLPGNHLEEWLESTSRKYETRSGNTSLSLRRTFSSLWNDKDESGDYTPKTKRSGIKPSKPGRDDRKRKRPDISSNDGPWPTKRSRATYASGRQKGLTLEVTFHFKSDAAKGKVTGLFPKTTPGGKSAEGVDSLENGDRVAEVRLPTHNEAHPPPTLHPSSRMQEPLSGAPVQSGQGDSMYPGGHNCPLQRQPSHTLTLGTTKCDPIIIDDNEDYQQKDDTPPNRKGAHQRGPTIIDYNKDSSQRHNNLPNGTKLNQQGPRRKVIRTNWTHPIQYGCRANMCSFCQDHRYSLFGCGTIEAEVIELEPGVYSELRGGHRQRGCAFTKICFKCCSSRVAIARCSRHDFSCINRQGAGGIDYQSFEHDVVNSTCSRQLACAVCISPGSYRCTRPQKVGSAVSLPATKAVNKNNGCGLVLCKDCAKIVFRYGLNMAKLQGRAGVSSKLRADRDFLLSTSDLWQACKRWR